jgi:hypothetical protein
LPDQQSHHIFSPGESNKVLGEDGAVYPAYAACSQSPGGTWTNSGPAPGAYMGHQSPVPGAGAPVAGAGGTPQSGQQQQQGATPQAALPSPLYPWMRSQFGEGENSIICMFNRKKILKNVG